MRKVKLTAKTVGVIVAPGFDDGQVIRVTEILKGMEAQVLVISLGDTVPAGVAGMRGALIKPGIQMSRLHPANLDALIIPGGNSTASMQADSMMLTLIMEIESMEKPIGAIGNGVVVLASAGQVASRRVTGDYRIKPAVEEAGATYLDQALVVDHNLVTAQSDRNLDHFVEAIAFLLQPATTLR
ncbi:MAG: DJ-1/PfpI family protein [Actinobacteria bacterium]|nr:DJ-1/PfpI family protein [Actinomycetota bacterium]